MLREPIELKHKQGRENLPPTKGNKMFSFLIMAGLSAVMGTLCWMILKEVAKEVKR